MYKKEEIILTANNVNLQYDEKIILRNVNFIIHNITRPGMAQGQVVSLIGRSGVGKTQLFRILAGLINPTSGNIKIGVDQHQVKAGEVGIVPQNYVLFNHRSVLENLKIGLKNCGDKNTEKQKEEIINE
ncbi:MAG: ATP-binding cassette domain-containing protein, partial [Cytophagales bacterium]